MLRSNLDLRQPIFALSSGSLPSAIAVVRLSGVGVLSLVEPLIKLAISSEVWSPKRGMWLADLKTLDNRKIDTALLLTFVGPHSFSGEDTIEFHCHGSIAIVEELQRQLVTLGARPAEKGEFSYRALMNGKITTQEVESLGDLYLAHSPRDLNSIFSRKDGAMEFQVGRLREQMTRLQAILDTAVDFSDEYSSVVSLAEEPLTQAIQECSSIIQRYTSFRGGSTAPRLVLAGRPNAGKSSLFNALLGRYRAIVNDQPGTTRDVIEEDIELGGVKWKLVDTAGIREAAGLIESEGLVLGSRYLAASSLWLLVVDGSNPFSEEERSLLKMFGHIPYILVWNKADLPSWKSAPADIVSPNLVAALSAKTGLHLDQLAQRVASVVDERLAMGEMSVLPTSVQSARLGYVQSELEGLTDALKRGEPPEYLGERNRRALSLLEDVIGEVSADEVLDRVFGEFCIGK
jgi:tRNA modification GTPase